MIVDTVLMADQLRDGRLATDRAKVALGSGDLAGAQAEINDASAHLTLLQRELEVVVRRAADEMVIVIPAVSLPTGVMPSV